MNREKILENKRRYRKANKAKINAQHRDFVLKKYGLNEIIYNTLADGQGFCCAICRAPEGTGQSFQSKRLAVDHCHNTKVHVLEVNLTVR